MKFRKIIHGKVENGKLFFELPELQEVAKNTKDGDVEIVIRKPRKEKTSKQHKYYFGVIVQVVSDWSGYDTFETHELLKNMFLPLDTESTMELSTTECEEMNKQIRQYFDIHHNLFIPLPNEYDYYT